MAEALADNSETWNESTAPPLSSLGDYNLLSEVGRGGMGVIYKAWQRSLNRTVAVKVLAAGPFASPEYVRRFRTEAAAAARLQHPNIVAVHEVGEADGIRYFSMDFVEGQNLGQYTEGAPLLPDSAARILQAVAQAIQFAHDHGILHRDLKPANVLIDKQGQPRVTDFGLARELSQDSDLTVTGQVLGTPGFLPPEQADATRGPLSPAVDVYSLGAILYYMLTGRPPFVTGSMRETLRRVLTEDPLAPRLLNPEIPGDLETICLKCLERDPARRYARAGALAEDLARYLAREPILARRVSAVGRFTRWCRRRPALAAVWLLSVMLALGSTLSAVWIARARANALTALNRAQKTEAWGRERMREARLDQAQALRHTTMPGRRAKALSALREAAQVRVGDDLRDEALAMMLLPDVGIQSRWDPKLGLPATITFNSAASIAAVRFPNPIGFLQGPAGIFAWGQNQSLGNISVGESNKILGPMRFDASGKIVMARCQDETLRIWRIGETNPFVTISNRSLPRKDKPTEGFNQDYDFSPDGSAFVLGLDKGLSLHRTSDGAELARSESGERFYTLKFTPDGKYVAGAQIIERQAARKVYVYRLPELTNAATFTAKESPQALAWSSDSRVLALALADSTIALFDPRDGHLLKTLLCPDIGQDDLVFLGEDSLLGVRSTATTFKVFDVSLGREELSIPNFGRSPIAVQPKGKSFVTTSVLSDCTRWEVEPAIGLHVLSPPRSSGYQMTFNSCGFDFSPDGRWVVSGHGYDMILRDVASGRLADSWESQDRDKMEFSTVAFVHGGRAILRNSNLYGLQLVALEFGTNGLPHFEAPMNLDSETGFLMADHLENGQRAVLINQEKALVKIIEVKAERITVLSRWQSPSVYSGALSPDGQFVLLNFAGSTELPPPELHKVSDGSLIRKLPAPSSCDVVWSTKGNLALTSNGQKLSTLWNTVDWKPVATFKLPLGGDTTTFTLSPDESYGVINVDEFIYLVSTRDGSKMARLEIPGAAGLAAGIRFLPDGRRFATLWRDGRIDIVDPEALRRELVPLGLSW